MEINILDQFIVDLQITVETEFVIKSLKIMKSKENKRMDITIHHHMKNGELGNDTWHYPDASLNQLKEVLEFTISDNPR